MNTKANSPTLGADGWLYVTGHAITSMGARSSWTRHRFVNGRSLCGASEINRLNPGHADLSLLQGSRKECKRCAKIHGRKPDTEAPDRNVNTCLAVVSSSEGAK